MQVNPRALAAYGLNIDDLRTTLGNANVNTPKGNFDGPAQASTINANDQITERQPTTPNLVIAYRNGAPVRLTRRRDRGAAARRTPSSPPGPTARRR